MTKENFEYRMKKKNLVTKTNWRKIWDYAKRNHEKRLGPLQFNDNQQHFIREVERQINHVLCGVSSVTITFPEPEARNAYKRPRVEEENQNPLSVTERERMVYL